MVKGKILPSEELGSSWLGVPLEAKAHVASPKAALFKTVLASLTPSCTVLHCCSLYRYPAMMYVVYPA